MMRNRREVIHLIIGFVLGGIVMSIIMFLLI